MAAIDNIKLGGLSGIDKELAQYPEYQQFLRDRANADVSSRIDGDRQNLDEDELPLTSRYISSRANTATARMAHEKYLSSANTIENIGNELPEGFGDSRFDKRVTDLTQLNDLEDFRANEQSAVGKILNGVAKGAVIAGTTFTDSLVGTAAGILEVLGDAISGEYAGQGFGSGLGRSLLNSFIDNPVSNFLQDINKASEEWLPNYRTQLERERPWYQNIFTANFLGDTLLKNAGFTVGAMYGGNIAATGLAKAVGLNEARNAFKGLAKELGQVGKSESQVLAGLRNGTISIADDAAKKALSTAAKQLRGAQWGVRLGGLWFAAQGEARIEALNAADEFQQMIDASYGDIEAQKEAARDAAIAELQAQYPNQFGYLADGSAVPTTEWMQQMINQKVAEIDGKYDSIQEEIQRRKAGVANSTFLWNTLLLTASDYVQFGRFLLGDYATDKAAKNIARNVAGQSMRESIEKNGLKAGMKNVLDSGIEATTTKGVARAKAIGKGVVNALTEMSEEMNQSWISSTAKNYGAGKTTEFTNRLLNPESETEVINAFDAVKEGFKESWGNTDDWVEGFAGFIMGAFGLPGVRVQADKQGKKKLKITGEGGVWEPLREFHQTYDRQSADIAAVNKALADDKFLNYFWGTMGREAIREEKRAALYAGDEYGFDKFKDKEFVNDLVMYDRVGRLEDIDEMITAAENVSEKDLDDLKALYANNPEVARLTDDGLLSTVRDNAKQMREQFNEYKKISEDIRTLYGDSMSPAAQAEMIWKTFRLNTLEKNISDRVSETSRVAGPLINKYRAAHPELSDKTDYELFQTDGLFSFIRDKKNNADLVVSSADVDTALKNLDVISKGAKERNDYIDTLAELSQDPELVDQRIQSAAKEAQRLVDLATWNTTASIIGNAKSAKDLMQFVEDDGTIDEKVFDEIKRRAKEESGPAAEAAKEFIALRNSDEAVNSKIDELASARGLSEADVEKAKSAWNYVYKNADSIKGALHRFSPENIGVADMTDDQIKLMNDAIEEVAADNEYASFLAESPSPKPGGKKGKGAYVPLDSSEEGKGPEESSGDSIPKQSHRGDPAKKMPITPCQRLTLRKEDGVVDADGNPVSGIYYCISGKSEVYDNAGNLIPKGFKYTDSHGNTFSQLAAILPVSVMTPVIDMSSAPWESTADNEAADNVIDAVPREAPGAAEENTPSTTVWARSAIQDRRALPVGSTIGFGLMRDSDTVYILDSDNNILGELPNNPTELGNTELANLVKAVRSRRNGVDVDAESGIVFRSNLNGKINSINSESLPNTNEDSDIKDLVGQENGPESVDDIVFYFGGTSDMAPSFSKSTVVRSDIVLSKDPSPGTVYMLLPTTKGPDGRQMYRPVACRKPLMTADFLEAIKGSPLYDKIKAAVEKAFNDKNTSPKSAWRNLQQYVRTTLKSGAKITLKEGGFVISGGSVLSFNPVTFTDPWTGESKTFTPGNPIRSKSDLFGALVCMHCPVQINSDVFNTPDNIRFFYENIAPYLGVNLSSLTTQAVGFSISIPNVSKGKGAVKQNLDPETKPRPAPVPAGVTLIDGIRIATTRGDFVVDRFALNTGDKGIQDANTGRMYTWEEAKSALGESNAAKIYSESLVNEDSFVEDGPNSIEGVVKVTLPDGRVIAYNSRTKRFPGKAALDIFLKRLEEKNAPTEDSRLAAEAEEAAAETPGETGAEAEVSDESVSSVDAFDGFELQVVSEERRTSEMASEEEAEFDRNRSKYRTMASKASTIYNALRTFNGKTMRGLGGEKKARKELSKVLPKDVVEFLITGVEKHPEFAGLTPYTVFALLMREQMYDIASEYNESVQKSVNRELNAFLETFLKRYNINVSYSDLKSRFGNDVVGLFDVLAKTIYLSNGGNLNEMTMPEEFAHAFIELMGSVVSGRPENADYTFLMNTVQDTEIYRQVYNVYKDIYKKNGEPDMQRIAKEAVGQALATAIVHNWNNKPEQKEKGFWDKLKELFNKIIDMFRGVSHVSFELEIDKIANEILAGDVSRLAKVDNTGYKLLDYVETIENQNKKDGGKALDFMRWFCDLGNIITGSLAYRRQGTVYRGKLDSLHDIDMIVPASVHGLDPKGILERYNYKTNKNQDFIGEVLSSDYFRKIKEKYPKIRFANVYNTSGYITVNAVYSEDEGLSERFASYTGSYADRLDRFTATERSQIYLFDFFLKNPETVKTQNDDVYGLTLTDATVPFREKLKMGRSKDIFDYQMWTPFSEIDQSTNDDMMFQVSKDSVLSEDSPMMKAVNEDFQQLAETVSAESLDLEMQKDRTRTKIFNDALSAVKESQKAEPAVSMASVNAVSLSRLKEAGWTEDAWDKLSEREKEQAKECVNV